METACFYMNICVIRDRIFIFDAVGQLKGERGLPVMPYTISHISLSRTWFVASEHLDVDGHARGLQGDGVDESLDDADLDASGRHLRLQVQGGDARE
jgi:hypothetical protein